jgi:hypothetical protein
MAATAMVDVGLARRGKMGGAARSGWAFGAQRAAPLHEQAAAIRELLAAGLERNRRRRGSLNRGVTGR